MPNAGPFTRVTDALEARRDRAHRRPVDGTSVRLGALLVFLALIVLMVLAASPSMATTQVDTTQQAVPVATSGFVNLAPILFWATVVIGMVVRTFLVRRSPSGPAEAAVR